MVLIRLQHDLKLYLSTDVLRPITHVSLTMIRYSPICLPTTGIPLDFYRVSMFVFRNTFTTNGNKIRKIVHDTFFYRSKSNTHDIPITIIGYDMW